MVFFLLDGEIVLKKRQFLAIKLRNTTINNTAYSPPMQDARQIHKISSPAHFRAV